MRKKNIGREQCYVNLKEDLERAANGHDYTLSDSKIKHKPPKKTIPATPIAITGTTFLCLEYMCFSRPVNCCSSATSLIFTKLRSSLKDSTYQSRTLSTCGFADNPYGKFSSSATRCANLTGSSLCRNCAESISCRSMGLEPKSSLFVWRKNYCDNVFTHSFSYAKKLTCILSSRQSVSLGHLRKCRLQSLSDNGLPA